ncbi:condensin complex subunit 2/barren [Absidia repens]|uniref:Condensin complex subunit 2 n=1 Tax=Absidia repens TaxID=90262 RepID=A0A1X2I6I6_9FUNG|nr:condensin complex subunit 2/barren [Absidia repens]
MTRPSPTGSSIIDSGSRDKSLPQKRPRNDNSFESTRDRLTRDVLTRQNNPTATNSTTMSAPLPVVPTVSPEQMYSNFEEWIKMATDNKINATNSWNFALIDYFHEMTFIRDGDSINFQRASCTLDGCVKIYTSRVDSVATETGKLLTGLADQKKDGLDDGDHDGEDGGHERRSRRRTHRSEATLLKDFSSLALKKLDVDFAVDPLFKKTSADFDEGGARGLLLNHLNLDQDCKIIFDSSDARREQDDDDDDDGDGFDADTDTDGDSSSNDNNSNIEDHSHQANPQISSSTDGNVGDAQNDDNDKVIADGKNSLFDNPIAPAGQLDAIDDPANPKFMEQEFIELSTLKARLRLDDLFCDLQICPTLNQVDFFTDGTISVSGFDKEDNDQDGVDRTDTAVEDEEEQVDAPEEDQFDYGYDAFDFGDDDAGDDGQELMDPFADPVDGDDTPGEDGRDDEHNTMEITETDQVTNISTNQENELLSYFDTTLSKNWAGPTHWKLRKTKSTSVKQDKNHDDGTNSAATERSQKKPSARLFTIDFLEGEDIITDDIFALPRRANITVNNTKDHSLHLLPDDENFSSKQLLRYFMKPVFSVARWKNKNFKSQTDETTEIVDDGPHDVFDLDQGPDINYWAKQEDVEEPQGIDFGNDDLQFNDDAVSQFDDVPAQQDDYNDTLDFLTQDESAVYGDPLITNHQIKKTKTPYVDYARTAKRVDVRKLKENLWRALIMDPANKKRPSENGKVCGERRFTDVLRDLKKMYPPKVMKDISVPFCFICLLHLANEQNLVITGLNRADENDDGDDGDDHVLGDDSDWMASEDMLNEVKIVQIL